ncbi:MAG: hypothetical protein KKA73_09075 [Chloroflexi bacterium]|nr:hypothetical protein [Chloroflexota bacterium]
MDKPMSPQDLRIAEKTIGDYLDDNHNGVTPQAAGRALLRIRDDQGFRHYGYGAHPDPFASYLLGEWKMDLAAAQALIDLAAEPAIADQPSHDTGICQLPDRDTCESCPALDDCTVAEPGTAPAPAWGIDDQPPLVDLDALILDDEIQLASRPLDYRIVAAYAEALVNGAEFPPITVLATQMKFFVADGFHRVAAHRAAGRAQVRADIKAGTYQDALIYAATANVAHGRAMTQAEKREAGYRLIQLTDLSNREIGRRLAVSEGSVRNWRDTLSAPSAQFCADGADSV